MCAYCNFQSYYAVYNKLIQHIYLTLCNPDALFSISEKLLRKISLQSLNGGSNSIFGFSTRNLMIMTDFITYPSSSKSSPKSFPFCNIKYHIKHIGKD